MEIHYEKWENVTRKLTLFSAEKKGSRVCSNIETEHKFHFGLNHKYFWVHRKVDLGCGWGGGFKHVDFISFHQTTRWNWFLVIYESKIILKSVHQPLPDNHGDSIRTLTLETKLEMKEEKFNKIRISSPAISHVHQNWYWLQSSFIFIDLLSSIRFLRATQNNPPRYIPAPSIQRSVRVVKTHFMAEGENSALFPDKRIK